MIAVTDNVQAKLFLVNDREINLVRTISMKTDFLPGERNAIKTGAGDMRSAEPEDKRKDWSREELYDAMSADLLQRMKAGEFEEIAFTVPADVEEELKDCLHIDLLKRAKVFIPKLLTGEDALEIAARVQEEM